MLFAFRGGVMPRSLITRATVVLALASLGIALSGTACLARSKRLKPPPDVDLDPDRAMSFGRLSKSPFDRSISRPLTQAISPVLVMDPSVDPFNSVVKPSRYEPQTGEIRGGLVDRFREMAHLEEQDRRVHPASPAGIYKAERQRTPAGLFVRPPTPQTNAGLYPLDANDPLHSFQSHNVSSLTLLPE